MKRVGKTVGNRKIHTQIHMKLGTRCYQRPWKTCRTSWSHSPPIAHSTTHTPPSCEPAFTVKLWKTIRTESFIKFAQPSPSSLPHPPHTTPLCHEPLTIPPLRVARGRGKAISYPQSGHFSVSLQPFLLLLLFYSALISKVALRVPKIISNGITLNEMQSTSSTNNKQQQQQQQQSNNKSNKKRGRW